MLIPLILLAALYFIFKDSSERMKKTVVLAIALVNAAQHLLKPYIYPQYKGFGFGAICTPYNMCALLILASPIILLVGSELWRNFLFYIGSIAGYSSILVTYWLLSPMEEQIRFVICHGLLFISSFLPLLLGIFKVNYRKAYKLPIVFFICIIILIITNIINFTMGIAGDTGNMSLYDFLMRENPCWSMHAPWGYSFVEDIVSPFTPSAFLESKGGVDTPVMWYFFPMWILITVVGLILGAFLDRKRFLSDMKKAKQKILKIFAKDKQDVS